MKRLKFKGVRRWMFKQALKMIARSIVHSDTRLTPRHLLDRKWILKDGYYQEPGLKDRDLILVRFEGHHYLVFRTSKLHFVALESSLEWFETFLMIIHGDNGRYDLAGVN